MKIPGAVIPLGIRLQSAALQLLGWKAQLTLPTMMEDTWRWQSEATSGRHARFLFERVTVAVSLLTAWAAAFDLRQAVSAASLDPSQQVNKPQWLRELKAGPYRLRGWPLRGQLSELSDFKAYPSRPLSNLRSLASGSDLCAHLAYFLPCPLAVWLHDCAAA